MNPVFLPMVFFLVIFGLLVGGFIFLIIKITLKTKNSYWKGKITDKLYHTQRSDINDLRMANYYTLVVKTDEGLTRKIAVTKKMYDGCKIGDTLEKPKGALNPIKI